jgi:hypothetical protein
LEAQYALNRDELYYMRGKGQSASGHPLHLWGMKPIVFRGANL